MTIKKLFFLKEEINDQDTELPTSIVQRANSMYPKQSKLLLSLFKWAYLETPGAAPYGDEKRIAREWKEFDEIVAHNIVNLINKDKNLSQQLMDLTKTPSDDVERAIGDIMKAAGTQ